MLALYNDDQEIPPRSDLVPNPDRHEQPESNSDNSWNYH